MSNSKQFSKTFAVFGVLMLMSGLVLGLFGEARAVDMKWDDSTPLIVRTSGSFFLDVVIPDNERVPIQTITAVLERQADGASNGDKRGASVVARASCDFTGSEQICANLDLVVSNNATRSIITSIGFVGYYKAGTNEKLDAGGSFGPGPITGYTTGYGYDTTGAYGYGYDLGGRASFNDGYGYGYGRTDGQDLALRFHIIVNALSLALDTHFITVLADTGSPTIGSFSSPYHTFQVLPRPGGGVTPPAPSIPDVGTGGGGGGGETGTGSLTVPATPVTGPAGSTVAFSSEGISTPAGTVITIDHGDPNVAGITFTTATALEGATITTTVFDAPPGTTGPLPDGTRGIQFIQITVSSGGIDHTVAFAVTIPDGEDASKAVLVKWDGTAWVAQGRIVVGGETPALCCSDFAVIIDEMDPMVNLHAPSIEDGWHHYEAEVADNLGVARVEFYLNGELMHTVTSAPYTWSWDAENAPSGDYIVKAVAYDLVDNEGEDSREPITMGGPGVTTSTTPWSTILIVFLIICGLTLMVSGGLYYRRSKSE